MSNPKTIKIDEVEYVRADSVTDKPSGSRAVVVVDRGWIFAGDVTRANGRIMLTRAVWLRNWSEIGFDGVLANPNSPKLQKRALKNPVDIPEGSEIFCIPVSESWGI
jgi:hypothetical protein